MYIKNISLSIYSKKKKKEREKINLVDILKTRGNFCVRLLYHLRLNLLVGFNGRPSVDPTKISIFFKKNLNKSEFS